MIFFRVGLEKVITLPPPSIPDLEEVEEVKRIVRETEGDPSELARQLSELTGLSVGSNDVE